MEEFKNCGCELVEDWVTLITRDPLVHDAPKPLDCVEICMVRMTAKSVTSRAALGFQAMAGVSWNEGSARCQV